MDTSTKKAGLSCKVSQTTKERFKLLAGKRGITASELLREMVDQYVSGTDDKQADDLLTSSKLDDLVSEVSSLKELVAFLVDVVVRNVPEDFPKADEFMNQVRKRFDIPTKESTA